MTRPSSSIALIGLALVLCAASCRPSSTRQTPQRVKDLTARNQAAGDATHQQAPEPAAADSEPATGNGSHDALVAHLTPTAEQSGALDSGDPDESTSAEPRTPSKREIPERLLLFPRGGILVIDLHLFVDGCPHTEAIQQLVDHVCSLADSDGDGRTTWDELTSHPRFIYGQFGNPPVMGQQQRYGLIRMYDVIQNRLVDRDEVLGFITSTPGSARYLELVAVGDAISPAPAASALWSLFDLRADGCLDADELDGATDVLRRLDIDDNWSVVRAGIEADREPASSTASPYSLPASLRVTPYTNWVSLAVQLQEYYALGSALTASDLPLTPALVERLDRNGNHEVDSDEVQHLADIAPDVVLCVRFGDSSNGERRASIEAQCVGAALALGGVRRPAPSATGAALALGDATTAVGDSLTLVGAQLAVTVRARDTAASAEDDAQRSQQLMARADADRNEYLDEQEFGQLSDVTNVPVQAVDADGDQKVVTDELRAFLGQQQLPGRSRIRISAGFDALPLYDWLDADHDGRLGEREMLSATSRLKALDRDGDGSIVQTECPVLMLIHVQRGISGSVAGPLETAQQVQAVEDAPVRWFHAMDANQDGEVSWREFPGTDDQFQLLDADRDGFLTVAEALAAAEAGKLEVQ